MITLTPAKDRGGLTVVSVCSLTAPATWLKPFIRCVNNHERSKYFSPYRNGALEDIKHN